LWRIRDERVWITRAPGNAAFGPEEAHALDTVLLRTFASRDDCAGSTLVVIEDSTGHAISRAAELMFVSRYLGHHAATLALLRARGVRIVGLLTGTGHSAAFFANALQAPAVVALADARVVAMEPAAIARVTRLPAEKIAALIEGDPLVGHPVRQFASWGGVDEVRAGAVDEAVEAIVGRERSGAR
jgi:malonate decarboxylase gamma subunit